MSKVFDYIIIGAGVSGIAMANRLQSAGARCLVLEAGQYYLPESYPKTELEGNAKLYWSGGIELTQSADIGLLRPKCVGGGSVVNQALLDRFDKIAFDDWKKESGLDFFDSDFFSSYYQKIENRLSLQEISEDHHNENAKIFKEGHEKNGFKCSPVRRGQKNCRFEKGNDCIRCLNGCVLKSKQSMHTTLLPQALEKGLLLKHSFEVIDIEEGRSSLIVSGLDQKKRRREFEAKKIVLAAGAVGNSLLLLKSKIKKTLRLKNIGEGFFTHPQTMVLGLYEKVINAHKGAFQALKSDDPEFRRKGFKLENVFAPPTALSMLLPFWGKKHLEMMKKIGHMACIEVALRDSCPGKVSLSWSGRPVIKKQWNEKDLEARRLGIESIEKIFRSTGAREIIYTGMNIGLHLMGGLKMTKNPERGVVNGKFQLHESDRILVADSSVFPNAPGINPSLTIMALSEMAADQELGEHVFT